MPQDFDQIIARAGTDSFKYEFRSKMFGRADVLPLWVADMDFAVPDAVQQALQARAAHPVYGYTLAPESLYQALIDWLAQRHHWSVERDWIMLCPGVVPSLHAAILAFCPPESGVIVQPPVYAPFLAAPKICGRKLLLNPLKFEDGYYQFDFENLERCAADGARLLLLCSPHNPVGRVWQAHELQTLFDICRRHDIKILSDEIHADLIYPEAQHIPLARLAENNPGIITAVAPSKTFNIPGLGLSALVIPGNAERIALAKAFDTLHVTPGNPFSLVAFEAAYRAGAPWLDELLLYLAGTRDFVQQYLQQHLAKIKLIPSEGTYLLWLDCREMKMNDQQLQHFFVHEAGVGLSPGSIFGEQGHGFMRMNIGMPRSVIAQALENISRAESTRHAA